MMTQLLKKTVYTGVGLAAMAAERIQDFLTDLSSQRQNTMEKGEEVVNKFVADAEEEAKGLTGRARVLAANVIERLDLVTEDFQHSLVEMKEDLKETAEEVKATAAKTTTKAAKKVNKVTETAVDKATVMAEKATDVAAKATKTVRKTTRRAKSSVTKDA